MRADRDVPIGRVSDDGRQRGGPVSADTARGDSRVDAAGTPPPDWMTMGDVFAAVIDRIAAAQAVSTTETTGDRHE